MYVVTSAGPARLPPAEGTKGAQVAAILKQCIAADWNTVPIHTAGTCKEVRDQMLWTLGEWFTAAGARAWSATLLPGRWRQLLLGGRYSHRQVEMPCSRRTCL